MLGGRYPEVSRCRHAALVQIQPAYVMVNVRYRAGSLLPEPEIGAGHHQPIQAHGVASRRNNSLEIAMDSDAS